MTKPSITENELKKRIKWFIKLRWFAVIGLFIVITLSYFLLKIDIQLYSLYIVNGILLLYNTIFYLSYKRKIELLVKNFNSVANLQISLDLIILTVLLYFSGDLENPFISFYIFHMVIASILLTNRAAFLQATLATILLGMLSFLIYFNIIPHYHLGNVIPVGFCSQTQIYFLSKFLVLAITLYITVYMSTTIVNKLREREEEIEEANIALKKQDKLKSEYVLKVSHDLKGSLSAIQSYLKVILEGYAGKVSDEAKEMIGKAEKRCFSLIDFVDDLLNLSRIRASINPAKEDISIKEMVEKVSQNLASPIEKKKINLSIKGFKNNFFVNANHRELESVFMNLLENAIKYSPTEGKIEINCKRKRNSNLVQISVSDTGIGIPDEDLPNIFNDFFRAENAKKFDIDGTGLGLSIVKQIINSMGFDITVKSQVDKGTVFIFDLPLNN